MRLSAERWHKEGWEDQRYSLVYFSKEAPVLSKSRYLQPRVERRLK